MYNFIKPLPHLHEDNQCDWDSCARTMLLSPVNDMETEDRPGHQMPCNPPHFLLAYQPAQRNESPENSKEASEYYSITNEMYLRKPESLFMLEFLSSPHTHTGDSP